jgi:S-adenosylmethionine hydrolase
MIGNGIISTKDCCFRVSLDKIGFMRRLLAAFFLVWFVLGLSVSPAAPQALVLQSDFGTKDGAVAAMKGVAFRVDRNLPIFDLTHEIPPYHIWEASFRLVQVLPFWPEGTVFVSIVDPGVGTDRKSVVARTQGGQFLVGPDNGQWTFPHDRIGLSAMRRIDETRHRLPGSDKSHTFHGRDVYVHVAARLAAGQIGFDDVGPQLPVQPVKIPYQKPLLDKKVLRGNVPILDVAYGNVWTNIGEEWFQKLAPKKGEVFRVTLRRGREVVYEGEMPYVSTFGDVPQGRPLLYLNSLLEVSFALNQDNFAGKHQVGSGPEWMVEITKKR